MLGFRLFKRKPKHIWQVSPERAICRLMAGRRAEVVFDIGANVGRFSRAMVAHLDPARIYAFEADRQNFEALRARVAKFPTVQPLHLAMGDRVGEFSLHINATRIYNNSLLKAAEGASAWADIAHIGEEKIPVSTVDRFCSEKNITEIDVLKVDAEGADLMVLKGSLDLLARNRIKIIYCEVLFKEIFSKQGRPSDFLCLMDENGYEFFHFFGARNGENGQLVQTNMMFIRADLAAHT